MIKLLDIRCTGPSQTSGSLSGGNQQKVCLARADDEPKYSDRIRTHSGIDGAKKLVLDYLLKINREQGTTIIMISSELVELRSLCDRIGIVFEGGLFSIMDPDDPDSAYGLAMAGVREEVLA